VVGMFGVVESGGWWERGAFGNVEQDVASLFLAVLISARHRAFPWVLCHCSCKESICLVFPNSTAKQS